jgi:hypothetical protein
MSGCPVGAASLMCLNLESGRFEIVFSATGAGF